jgi:beta-glucosidase
MQGNDPNYLKVVSTPKHFDAYSGPEPDRHRFNAVVSPHDLEDTYAPAFRAAVVEANADSVMCAYNAVNGSPSCSSTLLLQDHLRDAWKFNGYVVSDCDAVADIARGHHAAVDNAHASAMALKAGTDLNCGRAYGSLGDAVKQGLISETDIDRALERLFTARFRLGMFNPPGTAPYQAIPISENNAPAHRQLSLQAARESIVLLKNDGILPLRADTQRNIAVVGPGANMLEVIEGNYNGTPPNPVLPLDGIRKQFGAHASIAFEPGSIFVAGNPSPVPFTVLRPEAGSKLFGLRAEYFDHSDFSGSPKIVRIDPSINFDWNRVSPGEGISVDGFAVRWAGEFAPPAAGQYEFSFRGPKGRYKVYLDDKLILDGGGTASLAFADSTTHPIRIEYVHQPEDTNIDLQWQPPAAPLREAAVQAARSADVTIAFVGLSPNLEGEEMHVDAPGFKGGDRTRIELPDVQEQLLGALLATGKPVIAVLMSGSAIALSPAAQRANAILEAWYPGEEGGAAIAETLAGDNNPAGRLPITFYRSTSDLPPFTDYTMAERTYRYYTGSVLYPFGYGLSYSRFAYRNLHLSTRKLKAGESLEVSAEVKNAGSRAGSEVIELYVTPPDVAGAPRLSMEGFQRVHLNRGQSKVVKFQLHPRELSIVAPNGSRSVQPGAYRLWVGGGQPGFSHDGAAAGFMIAGTTNLPK